MDAKFTHYLITRFNIKINGFGPEFVRPDARTEDWEIGRLPFFEQFCAPSVTGQTSKNFYWFIYCDPSTEGQIIKKIKTAIQSIASAEIVFVSGFDEMVSHIQLTCANAQTPYVITSRLDNDDAIGIHYIEDIQSNFIPEDQVILNLLGGVNYNVSDKVLTYHRHSLNNSFISLIEMKKPAGELDTVMGFRHLTPKNTMTIKNIQSRYSFWMTLHHQNAATRINLGWPIALATIIKHYNINPDNVKISFLNTVMYTVRWFPGAVVKKIKYIYRSKVKPGRKLISSEA